MIIVIEPSQVHFIDVNSDLWTLAELNDGVARDCRVELKASQFDRKQVYNYDIIIYTRLRR